MIFRQLFEPSSSSYTYLIGCPDTGETALIDPVIETFDRDMLAVQELGLKLSYTVETHIHADHVSGGFKLRALTDCKIAGPAMDELPCRDIGIREGEAFRVGRLELHPLYTPGHTGAHHAYLMDNGTQKMLFSGDALLIDACGRTDFQSGDAGVLYDSIHGKFYTLPDDTLVYPAHDYEDRMLTTVGQEKKRNPRLHTGVTRDEFIRMMDHFDFPNPAKMQFAVPGNERCGQCPDNMPPGSERLCEAHDQG